MSQGHAIGEYALGEDPDVHLHSALSPGIVAALAHDAWRVQAMEMTVALQSDPAQATVLRYASEGFTTAGDDEPAHSIFDGVLARAIVSRGLRPAPSGQLSDGRIYLTGEAQLRNDGLLDSVPALYEPDGRPVEIRIGSRARIAGRDGPMAPYRDFALGFRGAAAPWTLTRDSIVVPLRDAALKLRGPVYTSRYAGTGGIEGDDELKGQAKPQAYGRPRNVSPILVWEDHQIWQFHDGWAEACEAVYDAGVALTPVGDWPTVSTLINASISAGQFGTCLRQGVFRLGVDPAGQVTCDVNGERAANLRPGTRNWANGRAWANGRHWSSGPIELPVDTHAGVIWRLLSHRAGIVETEVNRQMLLDFEGLRPEKIGLFLPGGQDEPTVGDVCARVAMAGGGFFGCDYTGLIGIRLVTAPLPYAFVELTEHDFVAGTLERMPPPYGVAPWSWRAWFAPNWTIQASGLAGQVSATRKRALAKPGRVVSADDAAIRERHPSSGVMRLDLLMTELADAQAELVRQRELYRPGRWVWRGILKARSFTLALGQTVRLRHPRHGLAGGAYVVVTSIEEATASAETVIEMFGGEDGDALVSGAVVDAQGRLVVDATGAQVISG